MFLYPVAFLKWTSNFHRQNYQITRLNLRELRNPLWPLALLCCQNIVSEENLLVEGNLPSLTPPVMFLFSPTEPNRDRVEIREQMPAPFFCEITAGLTVGRNCICFSIDTRIALKGKGEMKVTAASSSVMKYEPCCGIVVLH